MFLERHNSEEARIQQGIGLFEQVRNIPYKLGLDGDPNKLVSEGVGNCTRKHLYLLPRLGQLGYKIDIGIAVFDWRQLSIPKEIVSLLNDPIQTHMFLFVDGNPIDATWPPYLPGFSSDQWDGVNSTSLGVTALKVTRFNPLIFQTRLSASSAFNILKNLSEKGKPTPFNNAFNLWLEGFQRTG